MKYSYYIEIATNNKKKNGVVVWRNTTNNWVSAVAKAHIPGIIAFAPSVAYDRLVKAGK